MFISLIVGSAAALETLQFLVKLSLAARAFTILPWFIFPTRSPLDESRSRVLVVTTVRRAASPLAAAVVASAILVRSIVIARAHALQLRTQITRAAWLPGRHAALVVPWRRATRIIPSRRHFLTLVLEAGPYLVALVSLQIVSARVPIIPRRRATVVSSGPSETT